MLGVLMILHPDTKFHTCNGVIMEPNCKMHYVVLGMSFAKRGQKTLLTVFRIMLLHFLDSRNILECRGFMCNPGTACYLEEHHKTFQIGLFMQFYFSQYNNSRTTSRSQLHQEFICINISWTYFIMPLQKKAIPLCICRMPHWSYTLALSSRASLSIPHLTQPSL